MTRREVVYCCECWYVYVFVYGDVDAGEGWIVERKVSRADRKENEDIAFERVRIKIYTIPFISMTAPGGAPGIKITNYYYIFTIGQNFIKVRVCAEVSWIAVRECDMSVASDA